ncbi:MAG: hypothetical protein Q8M83_04340 [bacterium]|nr:hypothetical protein [bacterium]
MRFFWAIIGVAIGAFIVIKSEWFFQNFGAVNWAEQHLGAEGGSRLFYKLVGLGVIFLSFFLISGILESIFWNVFGRLFGLRGQ